MIRSSDWRDFISGVVLIGCGVLIYYWAHTHLDLGTVKRMGPGMFPAATGVLFVILGGIIGARPGMRVLRALRQQNREGRPNDRGNAREALATVPATDDNEPVAAATTVAPAPPPKLDFLAGFIVLASIGCFALLLDALGLAAAILGLVVVNAWANPDIRLRNGAVLFFVMTALIYGIFKLGLGMPIVLFKWPL